MCGKNDVNNILSDYCGNDLNCICDKSIVTANNHNNYYSDKNIEGVPITKIVLDEKSLLTSSTLPSSSSSSSSASSSSSVSSSMINSKDIVKESSNKLEDDILSVATQWTQHSIKKFYCYTRKLQRSRAYRMLCRTTQPAHIIAIGILSFVLFAIWPNLIESEDDRKLLELNPSNHSGLTLVTYLGAFAAHFGAQIWMTFVSGLSLYFALPRHTFGLCQQILFPKYFAMNSVLSICTLIMFIKVIGGKWEFTSRIQVIALTLCACIEVFVRLYLAPPLLRLMQEKHKFEASNGSGQEIGYLKQNGLVRCPHYQKVHKSFRRIHMTIAIGNMTALLCTFLHLNYLASKIRVS